VNGYALTFAVLMLTGGKLADMLGRRLIFIVGLAVFTASSRPPALPAASRY
jgi:MFS family permease